MKMSDQIDALAKALAAAQAEIENASKNTVNGQFRNKYADLAEVLNTVRPVFSKHGLAIVQFPGYENGLVSVETIVTHDSGQWMSNTLSGPCTKPDPQGVGSCISYYRRYSLAAAAGIAQEDDDANAASGKGQNTDSVPSKPVASPKQIDAINRGLEKLGITESTFCVKYGVGFIKEMTPEVARVAINDIAGRIADIDDKNHAA